jgi:hypothetical protein
MTTDPVRPPGTDLPFAGRAFGLDIAADFAIPGVLEPREPGRRRGEHTVTVSLAEPEAIARAWPQDGVERTFELPGAGGARVFTINRHPDAGHRVRIAELGECLIATDGSHIAYAATADPALRWRLLFGQGLPIAAALAGLEVLHASAVVRDARALAISGPSGSGKTATALQLMTHGAEFLADDVVALEEHGDSVIAHSGLGVAHVSGTERAALVAAGVSPPAAFDAGAKHHIALPIRERSAPLSAMYFLNRGAEVARASIVALSPPDPRLLLGATFVAHVPTAARLIAQLDICARLASTVPTFRIDVPRDSSAAEVAALIAEQTGAPR